MYLDYKRENITKEGKNNLISMICELYRIEKNVVLKYIQIYAEYPYISLSDTDIQNKKITNKRLKNILRLFKINKILKNN